MKFVHVALNWSIHLVISFLVFCLFPQLSPNISIYLHRHSLLHLIIEEGCQDRNLLNSFMYRSKVPTKTEIVTFFISDL